jgi:hypothetical protein
MLIFSALFVCSPSCAHAAHDQVASMSVHATARMLAIAVTSP